MGQLVAIDRPSGHEKLTLMHPVAQVVLVLLICVAMQATCAASGVPEVVPGVADRVLAYALSSVESGHRDAASGSAGEVSRYQIMPRVWDRWNGADPHDSTEAWWIARMELKDRLKRYRKITGIMTPAKLYALWNAPGDFERAGGDLSKMSKTVQERCARYQNVVIDIQANPAKYKL